VTASKVDDASTVPELLDQVDAHVERFTADGAYDARSVYEALWDRRAPPKSTVIPPQRGASAGYIPDVMWRWRRAHINSIVALGRARWHRASGYHRQTQVENAMFRYKRLIGTRLRAISEDARKVEAVVACNVLNRMTGLGRPRSTRIAAEAIG
jgi:hypothetical protein